MDTLLAPCRECFPRATQSIQKHLLLQQLFELLDKDDATENRLHAVDRDAQAQAIHHVLAHLNRLVLNKSEWNEWCYLVTLETLQDHPKYRHWTTAQGRIECFQSIRPLLEQALGLVAVDDDPMRMVGEKPASAQERYQARPRDQLVRLLTCAFTSDRCRKVPESECCPGETKTLLGTTFLDVFASPRPNVYDSLGLVAQDQNHPVVSSSSGLEPPALPFLQRSFDLSSSNNNHYSNAHSKESLSPVFKRSQDSIVSASLPNAKVCWIKKNTKEELWKDRVLPPAVQEDEEEQEEQDMQDDRQEKGEIVMNEPTPVRVPRGCRGSDHRCIQNIPLALEETDTRIRDKEQGKPASFSVVRNIQHQHAIRAMAFNSQGTQVAIGTNGKALLIYDLRMTQNNNNHMLEEEQEETLSCVHHLANHHQGSIYSVAWSMDDTLVASASSDKLIRVYRASSSSSEEEADIDDSNNISLTLRGHPSGLIRDVVFSNDKQSSMLCCGGAGDFSVRVWDLTRPAAPVLTLRGHERTVHQLSFANNDPQQRSSHSELLSVSEDRTMRLWDLRTGGGSSRSCAQVFRHHHPHSRASSSGGGGEGILALSMATTGRQVMTGHQNGSTRLWDLRMDRPMIEQHISRHHAKECRSVALRREDESSLEVLAASFDHSISYANATSGVLYHTLSGHEDRVLQVKWHPTDRSYFMSSGADCIVNLWKRNK